MKKKTTLKVTFTTSQIQLMDEILKKLSGDVSVTILNKTEFKIIFNPYGAYYNLYIVCDSKVNAETIRNTFNGYIKNRTLTY